MTTPSEVVCPKCGAEVQPGARFCESCGASLTGAAAGGPSAARLAVTGLVVAGFVGLVFLIASMREKSAAPAGEGGGQASFPPPAANPVQKREAEERVKALEAVAKGAPQDAGAWLALAEARYELVTLDPSTAQAAIEAADKVLEIDPGRGEALKIKGHVFYDTGRSKEAAAAYEAFLKIVPDDPNVRTDLGTMYLDLGEADKAIAEYEKVLADHPEFVNAQFNLGQAYHLKGDTEKQIEAYEKARSMPGAGAEIRARADQLIARLKAPAASGQPGPGTAALPEGHPPIEGAGAGAAPAPAPGESPKPGGTLRSDVEAVFTGNPVLGPRVTKIEWSSDTSLKVTLRDFPIQQMPEDHMKKFSERVAGARKGHGVETPIRIEFASDPGGEVQATIEG